MSFTLTLCLPSLLRLVDDVIANEVLAQWLARGNRNSTTQAGITSALQEWFQLPGCVLPVAALTRQYDNGDADSSVWLRCDPAYVHADIAAVRMLACGDLGLADDETKELSNCLKPIFAEASFIFDAATPERWYLRCQDDIALPEFAAPDDMLGADLSQHMPSGDSGRQWRALLNEVQITLHNHSLNAIRTARGQLAINSVWVWGAGRLPSYIASHFTQVLSHDVLLRALARQAGVASNEIPQSFDDVPVVSADANVLVDLRTWRGEVLRDYWLAPIDFALRSGQIHKLNIYLLSGERIEICPYHRFRFWRRAHSLWNYT